LPIADELGEALRLVVRELARGVCLPDLSRQIIEMLRRRMVDLQSQGTGDA
jgi:hypothetical protein